MGGSCQVPLGGYAIIDGGAEPVRWLRGFVATADGRCVVRGEVRGNPADAESIGRSLARQLRSDGADEILAALANA